MSEAPERIWVWKTLNYNEKWKSVEYVRADRIEELEAKLSEIEARLAKAVEASYQLGMEAALKVIASIGYGKNEDVDCGHEEAFRAVEAHLADWKAATLAELKGEK